MTQTSPLLTISIPTYKRASYLSILLQQLQKEVAALAQPLVVEVLISDNASPDDTEAVVRAAMAQGLAINYLRNAENIGSDRNIAQCFNAASGKYVLIMGDDDVLVDGMLANLLAKLEAAAPGVVLLRAYGYDDDFRAESPGTEGDWVAFPSVDSFLQRAGAQISLISACVINKQLVAPLDANQFVGGNLVQVHLVLRALLKAGGGMTYEGFAVACKRNNSGGYVFTQVFVIELGKILDSYQGDALSAETIRRYESRLLLTHHPYYVWRQLRLSPADMPVSKTHFEQRFGGRWEYVILIRPIYSLPRPLAWLWAVFALAIGRGVFGGDFRRGLHFVGYRLARLFGAGKA